MALVELDKDDVQFIRFLCDVSLKTNGLQVVPHVNKLMDKLGAEAEAGAAVER